MHQSITSKLKLKRLQGISKYQALAFVFIFAIIGGYIITRSFVASATTADFNNDGQVNVFDLSKFLTYWGT